MKTLENVLNILFLVIIFGDCVAGQYPVRRPLDNPPPIQIDNAPSPERAKIIEQCETPTNPKPQGEIKRVSRLGGKAISLPKPTYPREAKARKASGSVEVNVVVDEEGRVLWANSISGDPLLRDASKKAACRARYTPTWFGGRAVKTETIITYNFVHK